MTKHGMIKASSAISEEHHITQKYNTYQITEKLLPYNRESYQFFSFAHHAPCTDKMPHSWVQSHSAYS